MDLVRIWFCLSSWDSFTCGFGFSSSVVSVVVLVSGRLWFWLGHCMTYDWNTQKTHSTSDEGDGWWVGIGQREDEGSCGDWLEVRGARVTYFTREKCDVDNHPHTRAHGCLNRLFSILNLVSIIRWSRRSMVGWCLGLGFYVLQFLYMFSAGVIYEPE